MRVFRDLISLPKFKNGILTVGTFDGVHFGHKAIIRQMQEAAQKISGETILLTFHPHPRIVLNQKGDKIKLIQTIEEKTEILKQFGLDNLIIVPFTKSFSDMLPEDYVRNFLYNNIKPHTVIIGYDHRFGKNRSGGIETFNSLSKELDFKVEEISAKMIDDITVSSTKIRNALLQGEIEKANELLGHNFSINGKVIDGKKIGRTIGFPTANLTVENEHKLIPANGVYAVNVKTGSSSNAYKGMANIGLRPTFNNGSKSIEVHIFEFNKDIYNQKLKVEFISFIRNEIKFNNSEELRQQLEIDAEIVKKLLY